MQNNLPIKAQKGLLGKIKNFFRNLFHKTDKNVDYIKDSKTNDSSSLIPKNEFDTSIKIEVDNSIQKELERNELFDKIVKNPNLLTTLSNEQLEMFIKYGNDIIKKNDEIINIKKAKIAKLKKVG